MSKKLAILQMSDTPQVESSAVMLRDAGYEVRVCAPDLVEELRRIGCDTVVPVESAAAWGCDPLDPSIGRATLKDMDRCDLFAEIKVNNIAKIKERWTRLRDRVCFWRVNGGRPEHVVRVRNGHREDCGDEWNPGAPAITANLWYERREDYSFWPTYPRAAMFDPAKRGRRTTDPFCVCHGVQGWGYNVTVPDMVKLGVRIYGQSSPNGIVPHSKIPELVAEGLCMVHLKTTDCPGWALYEAILGGCPVVVSRMLIARCRMEPLFDDRTCMMFGPPGTPDGHGDMGYAQCIDDVRDAISLCKSQPREVTERADIARTLLLELMWKPERDGRAFREYLERTFP